MSMTSRSVRVHQLPETVTRTSEQKFMQDLRDYSDSARPRFVVDCSRVEKMTPTMMQLLLSALEEAMKSNGDVRLAALDPHAHAVLVSAGISRIFETYPSVDLAVQSFRRAASSAALGSELSSLHYAEEFAA